MAQAEPDKPVVAKVAEEALPKAETRALWSDVALRSATRIVRNGLLDTVLSKVMTPEARAQTKPNSLGMSLIGMAAARIATKSLPGALLVSGGLIAKALYDRGAARKADADAEQTETGETPDQHEG